MRLNIGNRGFVSLAFGCILLYATILAAITFIVFHHHSSSHGAALVQVTTPGAVSVPEPGTLLLLAAGLVVVELARKVRP